MSRSALLPLAAALLVSACGTDPELPPAPADLPGERGEFLFEVTPDGALRPGPCPLTVTLRDAGDGSPIAGAEVTVSARMPAMGHPGSGTPVVTEEPAGVYHVAGLVLAMGGSWEVRVDARLGERTDTVAVTWELE